MDTSLRRKSNLRSALIILIAGVLFTFGAFVAIRLRAGHSFGTGLRSLPRTTISLVRSVMGRERVLAYNQGQYTNIIFLHHSTGNNLVEQGNIRALFTQAGYSFWDQGYNYQGLQTPRGEFLGYAYTIPRDNTDPDGLAVVFRQQEHNLPLNALSGLLQHEVIVIKSCFAPANQIRDDATVEQYKSYYREMRATMQENPDRLFIIMTTPPLNPAETDSEEARRARELANWLTSDEFLSDLPNVATFDFFDLLAEQDNGAPDANMLKHAYRNGNDSHPNQLANEEIGPQFVRFVITTIEAFKNE